MLNWRLLREPYNWAFIGLVALFWLVVLAVVQPQPSPGKT